MKRAVTLNVNGSSHTILAEPRTLLVHALRDDLNLSYPVDLLDINLKLLGDTNLIGKHVRLAKGCTVERSLIMDGVTVERPIAIRDSLIFPGVTIADGADLKRAIVTPGQVIECR